MKIEDMEEIVFGCCGVPVWLPKNFLDDKRKTKDSFYCPNGHSRSYVESTADRLQKELNIAKSDLESKNRKIADLKTGKCPFCWRTLKDLSAHINRCHN
jgi:hypothetical protein